MRNPTQALGDISSFKSQLRLCFLTPLDVGLRGELGFCLGVREASQWRNWCLVEEHHYLGRQASRFIGSRNPDTYSE